MTFSIEGIRELLPDGTAFHSGSAHKSFLCSLHFGIKFRLDKPRPCVGLSAMSNIKQHGRFFALCCLLVTLSCAGNKNGSGDPGSPPETPHNFTAMALDGQVRLSWNTKPNVTYELYHSLSSGFTLESSMKISPVTSPHNHEELTNGTTYYYRLRAVNDFGVSEPTDEISATPGSPPETPQNFTAMALDGQARLSWNTEPNVTYELYHSTETGFALENGMRISPVTSPYDHEELMNGTTYYYRLRAVNDFGVSEPTAEMSATPGSPPETPQNFEAMALDGQVRLSWNTEPNVTYELYHSTETGFALESGMKISPVTTPYDHEELMNDTTYYYRLRAVNDFGVSEPTDEISATPEPRPMTPQNFEAMALDGQVRLSWNTEPNVTYELYHSTETGFALENSMKISSVTSPYDHKELMNGTAYYYRLRAVNDFGASEPTDEISATPKPPPATPQNFTALASRKQVTLNWTAQASVTYNLFYATTAGIDVGSSTAAKFTNVTPPYIHTELTDDTTYYYRLTARNTFGTSAPTAEVSATPRVAEKISAGYDHTCAVASGRALCWGFGGSGRLGTGNNNSANTPQQAGDLTTGVTQISAGFDHTCAVVGGRAMCWGEGGSGQLGHNEMDSEVMNSETADKLTPTQVHGLTTGVTQISAGQRYTCALVGGGVLCWGAGNAGQLGAGNRSGSNAPQQVSGLTTEVTQISAGDSHACAVVNGAAWCWGFGNSGRLGTGSQDTQTSPQAVSGLGSGVTQISGGEQHTCAVVNGAAWCWGRGRELQLGHNDRNGATRDKSTPNRVHGLASGVTHISAGRQHTCAVVGGAAKCWGEGDNGRLGTGNNSDQTTPTQVIGLTSGVTEISAGEDHTCAVVEGRAVCWGNSAHGRLGNNNSRDDQNTPVSVNGL